MPIHWQLWDRIRSFARKANIYRTDNIYQDQDTLSRVMSGGNFIDFSKASALLEQTNLQINRLERYKDYDMMDEVGEVSLALDLFADEASLIDSERKHCIIVRAKNKRLKEEIEDFLFNTILIDREVRPMIRYLCKYGCFVAEIIPTRNRDGVASFRFINVYNFTRIQTKYGDLVGFFYQDPTAGAPIFLHPWQVMHLRLTSYETVYHPYGRCCDTKARIWTPTGSQILRDLNKGDMVYTFDGNKPVITKVLDKVITGVKKTLLINTKHRSIRVTPEHPIMIATKQYALASDLAKNDEIICIKSSNDGYLVDKIISIEDGGEIEVGDIQVSEHHNFIADGVVIHNSILDGGRKDFKRLRLMEDAAIVYRVVRAPEKLIFNIPVGNIPPQQVPQYIELIARNFKKHKFVDPSTGQINERYSPLIQADDFFLPKRADGSGPSIDTLPGAENLDAIADIEYFKKKMVAGFKIPFSRLGIGPPSELDGKSLASASPEFAKNIQWIQREVILGLKKMAIVHLALRGFSIEDLRNFDLSMTAASAIDELYRIETWNTRADVMTNLKEIGWFPPEWVIERFTDMTPDEIAEMQATAKQSDMETKLKEAIENGDEKFLQEYIENVVISMDREAKPVNSNLNFLINSKELDGLPSKNSMKLMVENSIDPVQRKAAIDQTLICMQGGTLSDDPVVKEIAAKIEGDEKVLVEDVTIVEDTGEDISSKTVEQLTAPTIPAHVAIDRPDLKPGTKTTLAVDIYIGETIYKAGEPVEVLFLNAPIMGHQSARIKLLNWFTRSGKENIITNSDIRNLN